MEESQRRMRRSGRRMEDLRLKILVSGLTGTTGSAVGRHLLRAGHSVRGLVRGLVRVGGTRADPEGLETAVVDFDDRRSLTPAFRGVDAAYLMVPASPRMEEWGIRLHDAAETAGVGHVVRLSILGGLIDQGVGLGSAHGRIDRDAEGRDFACTVLRPNGFMQNYLGMAGAVAGGAIYTSNGSGRAAIVDVEDIAMSVAAAIGGKLTGTFDLTGPSAVTNDEAAATLTAELGWSVEARTVPAEASVEAMLGAGLSAWLVDRLMEIQQATAEGVGAEVEDGVERLTGRAPGSFVEFVRRERARFLEARR